MSARLPTDLLSLAADQPARPALVGTGASATSKPATILLLFIAAFVRAAAIVSQYPQLDADPDGYRQLAISLAEQGILGTHGIASAYRPPLYPLLLVPLTALTDFRLGVALLHGCCGLATVAGCYRLGERWIGGRAAWFAALAIACDPILLRQSALVMTETVATLLAVLALLALTEFGERPSGWRAIVAGGCLGLATLCRPTFLPWCLLAPLAWWLFPGAVQSTDGAPSLISGARRAMFAFVMVLTTCLTLAPWIVRNQLTFGKPIATTTHGGYTLYLGNNREFYQHLDSGQAGGTWTATTFDANISSQRRVARRHELATPADEVSSDQREYDAALAAIRQQPSSFVRACTFRLTSLWGLRPQQGGMVRYLVGAWYAVEFALAGWGLIVLRRQWSRTPWSWGLLLVLTFTAAHAVYWSNLRMRAPLMPVVTLAAAAGLAALLPKALGRKSLS